MTLAYGLGFSVTLDKGWYTVTMPAEVMPGQEFEISITIKPDAGDVLKGVQLANHLQWAKNKDEYGGFLAWQAARDVKAGQAYVFKHNPKLDVSKMTGVQPIVFLAPGGDFEKRTKFDVLPVIPIKVDAAALAKQEAEEKRQAARARPATATLKKSFIHIVPNAQEVTKGDTFEMTVEYGLDTSDNWAEGTRLEIVPLGPWVDNPDGIYTKTRQHYGYPGLHTQSAPVAPGRGSKTFRYTLGATFRYNEIQWMAYFKGGDGKNWPWSVRASGPKIMRFVDGFDLTVPAEGGLFTYAEKPRVDMVWGEHRARGSQVEATFRIVNTAGKTVAAFTQNVTVGAKGTTTPIALPELTERGVMLLLATIDKDTRDAFFARIPGVAAKATPFGVTNVNTPELARVARKLGATYCRHFTNWNTLEPLAGQWFFDELDARVASNNAAGIEPWICLVTPPAWVMAPDAYGAGYEPFTFDAAAWQRTAATLATRYKGRVWGFEWLNEIVPGNKAADPVREYLDFCRIGTAAIRKVDPKLKVQLAGGLWPRNFRTDLLNSGVADFIDVLPIHYAGESGVREARHDMTAVGKPGIAVWDNETARGLSVWNMPPEENIVRSVMQSKWIMRQWPAELVAGAGAVVYFGGHTAAAGNWTYLLDDTTPRPVAATFAVIASKIGLAKPIATAYVGDAVLYIFEKDGRGLAVASTVTDADNATTTLDLPAGAPSILLTDHQGNERRLATADNTLSVTLNAMPVFLEGFDLATLAVNAGVQLGTQGATAKPALTAVAGSAASVITLRVVNPLARPVKGALNVTLGADNTLPVTSFDLAPNSDALINLSLAAVKNAAPTLNGTLKLTWTSPAAVSCTKPFTLTLIDPKSLGNLLKNGGMENGAGGKPADWSGDVERVDLASLGRGPGFEGHAARFSGTKSANYQHMNQSVTPPAPGRKYLYTAWVWNNDMQAGSNLSIDDKTFFIPQVFDAGNTTPFWRLLSHVRDTPPAAKSMSFTPVVRGNGWAMYDNLRVTLYDNTLFATEAARSKSPPVINGDLSDWDFTDPIPLLCDNQLTAPDGYTWSPANLSGVVKFTWDDQALYFAAKVRDDTHVANATGEETNRGDSLVIALHPGNRVEGADARAFAWLVSATTPGGGSGRHTLYRPPARSGGLPSGQLAKDSSVYELAIRRNADITTYELRIPWSETGGLTPSPGVTAGLSLQLFDADGAGVPAVMTWGGGLRPAWSPTGFGTLTLTD